MRRNVSKPAGSLVTPLAPGGFLRLTGHLTDGQPEPGRGAGTVVVLGLEAVGAHLYVHRLAVDLDFYFFAGQGITGHVVLAEAERARLSGEGPANPAALSGSARTLTT